MLRDLGSRCDQAILLSHLGDALATAGERRPAGDAWQQALDLLDELHHPDAAIVRAKLRGLGQAPGPPPGRGGGLRPPRGGGTGGGG